MANPINAYLDDVNGGCELPIDEEGRCEARHWVTNPGTRPVGTRCGAYVNPLTKGVEQSAQTLHTPSTTEEQKPRRGMPTPIKRRG